MVQYGRRKPFFEPPPTSNVPTRNIPRIFQSTQDRAYTHKHIDGTINHDGCLSFLPAPSGSFTPISVVRRPITSIPTRRSSPIISTASASRDVTRSPPVFSQSPTLEQPSPHTGNDVAIQSPTTLQTDTQPLLPENAFLHERQSPRGNVTEIVDAAARNFRRTPPENTSKMQLPPNTSSKRKAQPLFTSYLSDIVTSYNSPERETEKQSRTKSIQLPTGKRQNHHQK